MEENPMTQEELELPVDLKEEIEKTADALKAKDKTVKTVFPIVVRGGEYDDKEYYVAYFRQPTFNAFSRYLSGLQNNQQLPAMRNMAKECFLGGDKELIEDDSLFVGGLYMQLGKIVGLRQSVLVNLSKARK